MMMKNYIEIIEDTLIFHGFEAIKKDLTIYRSPENGKILIMPGHICGNGHMHHYELSDRSLKKPALALIFKDNSWNNREFGFAGGGYFLMDQVF